MQFTCMQDCNTFAIITSLIECSEGVLLCSGSFYCLFACVYLYKVIASSYNRIYWTAWAHWTMKVSLSAVVILYSTVLWCAFVSKLCILLIGCFLTKNLTCYKISAQFLYKLQNVDLIFDNKILSWYFA